MIVESKQRPYLYTVGGIGALLVFALTVQGFIPYPNIVHDSSLEILPIPAGAERYPNTIEPSTCTPTFSPVLDESSKVNYQIKTPHLLPVGYSLQGVDVVSSKGVEMATLYYWDRPICNTSDLVGGPSLNGAVIVRIANSLRVPDNHAEMIDTVNKMVPKYYMHQLMINGNPAIGYDSSTGLSTSALNGSEDGFPYPARIFVVSNKILYNIEANMPLEDLVKIAESIN